MSAADLRRRIDSAESLRSVARTMKALAAVRVQRLRDAVGALGPYQETVELGFLVLLRQHPDLTAVARAATVRRPALVAFGADQSMAGGFDERVRAHLAVLDVGYARRLALGPRLVAELTADGLAVDPGPELPADPDGITGLVDLLLEQIGAWEAAADVDAVHVVHNAWTGDGLETRTVHLLPLDRRWLEVLARRPWPGPSLPTYRLGASSTSPDRLFSALVREYLFVRLFRACAESLAAENEARLRAMQRAERNIGEHADELRKAWFVQRQQAITAELLDLVAGYAVSGGEG